jgi:rhamnogalacturonyl hydrolase YesR
VAAGLAELLSELPPDNPYHDSILKGYLKMMQALQHYQASDGMWRQLVDYETAWKETSASAMFGYAVAVGVKECLLSEDEFAPIYQKAWLALVEYVTEAGKVSDVCVGTGQSDELDFYLARPKAIGDLHGQAPMLWFAHCLLLMQDH